MTQNNSIHRDSPCFQSCRMSQPLIFKSKGAILAILIGSIAGIVIVGLGASHLFGPKGSLGFVASLTSGIIPTMIFLGSGIVWIAVANCEKSRVIRKAQEQSVAVVNQIEEAHPPLIARCLELYHSNQEAWVMVPTQTQILSGKQPRLGVGSASYEGAGHFKIHISIDPCQMKLAIPIVLETLHGKGTPLVGFKFQTEKMLLGDHQTGKEFALIFSEEAENNESSAHAIQNLLRALHHSLETVGISPESGMVLTPETHLRIKGLPEGVQPLEKRNLEQRKFDRRIPGNIYFYYRNEDFTAISDTEKWAIDMGVEGRKASKIVLFSEIDQMLVSRPDKLHNPLNINDPYFNIRIASS